MASTVICGAGSANITRLIVDTEFNGPKGQLISLALTSQEASNYFYEVLPMEEPVNPWVLENVVPVLHRDPLDAITFLDQLQKYLDQFMFVEFVYANQADRRYLDSVLAMLKRLPLHQFSHDRHLSAAKSKWPHNALADALAMSDEVYGTSEENEHGLTEREVMQELMNNGFKFDRRHVLLSYEAPEWQPVQGLPTHRRKVVKVTYTFNPKATHQVSTHGSLTLNFTVTQSPPPKTSFTAQGYVPT